MRITKWISPAIIGLGLAISARLATAGLLDVQPGACQPVKACEPVKTVELLPPACKPVRAYVPHVKPCEPVQAVTACGPVKTCEPVKTCDGSHKAFVLDRVANKVDRAIHATAYKIYVWRHGGYVADYSTVPAAAPQAPAPASAPAPLPAAPAPPAPSHS